MVSRLRSFWDYHYQIQQVDAQGNGVAILLETDVHAAAVASLAAIAEQMPTASLRLLSGSEILQRIPARHVR
jgi:hypothetical protein